MRVIRVSNIIGAVAIASAFALTASGTSAQMGGGMDMSGMNSSSATPRAARPRADVSLKELTEVADRFDTAQLTQNGKALEKMVSDKLVFISAGGKRLGKAEFIAGWTDPKTRFGPAPTEDRVIVPLGPDVGTASGAATIQGETEGKAFSTRIRFADTFRKIDGRWQAVVVQATRVP